MAGGSTRKNNRQIFKGNAIVDIEGKKVLAYNTDNSAYRRQHSRRGQRFQITKYRYTLVFRVFRVFFHKKISFPHSIGQERRQKYLLCLMKRDARPRPQSQAIFVQPATPRPEGTSRHDLYSS